MYGKCQNKSHHIDYSWSSMFCNEPTYVNMSLRSMLQVLFIPNQCSLVSQPGCDAHGVGLWKMRTKQSNKKISICSISSDYDSETCCQFLKLENHFLRKDHDFPSKASDWKSLPHMLASAVLLKFVIYY